MFCSEWGSKMNTPEVMTEIIAVPRPNYFLIVWRLRVYVRPAIM